MSLPHSRRQWASAPKQTHAFTWIRWQGLPKRSREFEGIARADSWQNGFYAGFYFLSRRIFLRIFSPDFSSHFVGRSAQKNPPGKSPAKSSKVIQQKSPTHFCRGAGPKIAGAIQRNLKEFLGYFKGLQGNPWGTFKGMLREAAVKLRRFTSGGGFHAHRIGHAPRGSYSRKGVLLPSKCFLESPF